MCVPHGSSMPEGGRLGQCWLGCWQQSPCLQCRFLPWMLPASAAHLACACGMDRPVPRQRASITVHGDAAFIVGLGPHPATKARTVCCVECDCQLHQLLGSYSGAERCATGRRCPGRRLPSCSGDGCPAAVPPVGGPWEFPDCWRMRTLISPHRRGCRRYSRSQGRHAASSSRCPQLPRRAQACPNAVAPNCQS